jgi:probable rRNA maturation factor
VSRLKNLRKTKLSSVTITITKLVDRPFGFKPLLFTRKIARLCGITRGSIDVTFVSNPGLVALNQQFLGRDYETDIITFNLGSTDDVIGDIYISMDQAQINADQLGHTLVFELQTLIVHGILHVLDYSDYTDEERSVMFAKQDELLALV